MIYPIYSVRDLKVGFAAPSVDMNDQSATRGFEYALSQSGSIMGFAPSDYELYCVGEFDSTTGNVTGCLPRFVINGQSAYYNSLKEPKDA